MHHLRNLIALALILITFTFTFNASANPHETRVVKLVCDIEKVKQAGDYGWTHPAYKDAEPPPIECSEGQKLTLKFFQVDRKIVNVDDVVEVMAQQNCWPSSHFGLLALGAQHPSFQDGKHIVAIGSVWTHNPRNPALQGLVQALVSSLYTDKEDGRNLGFDNYTSGWNSEVYFAAVCRNDG